MFACHLAQLTGGRYQQARPMASTHQNAEINWFDRTLAITGIFNQWGISRLENPRQVRACIHLAPRRHGSGREGLSQSKKPKPVEPLNSFG